MTAFVVLNGTIAGFSELNKMLYTLVGTSRFGSKFYGTKVMKNLFFCPLSLLISLQFINVNYHNLICSFLFIIYDNCEECCVSCKHFH